MKSSTGFLLGITAAAAEVVVATGGLIGFGIPMYQPACAFACRAIIETFPLECSVLDSTGSGHSEHGGTPAQCRAHDVPFLTSLAWCIGETCVRGQEDPVPAWQLEKFWGEMCTGDPETKPMWGFQRSLAEVQGQPDVVFGAEPEGLGDGHEDEGEEGEGAVTTVLNFTSAVDMRAWKVTRDTMVAFEYQETQHSLYGIILLSVGVLTPVAITLATRLPYMSGLTSRLQPYLVYPAILGGSHVQPLPFKLGNAPTAGQALWVGAFVALNVVVTAAGYGTTTRGNIWFATPWRETMAYLANRTGVLAFALAPLVVLLSSRNNFLLWLTDWSHATFLVLHRWAARVFGLQVVLHSVLELVLYLDQGELEAEQQQPYWWWGIVATVMVCAMLVFSTLVFRRMSYEVFLVIHIVMAIFVIVGSWYHVDLLFERKWGYELWLYAACGVWLFDRVMRLLRVLKNGIRRAEVSHVAPDIVRIDIPGIRWDVLRPGRHVYAYFPTAQPLRPWENHPFSVVPTALLRPRRSSVGAGSEGPFADPAHGSTSVNGRDLEKYARVSRRTASTDSAPSSRGSIHFPGDAAAGITLYVRKASGMTSRLRPHASLLTLLDGPYPNNNTAAVLKCDRLVLIAGGIGITGVLGFVGCGHANVRLCWSVREETAGLARDLEHALSVVPDKEVCVGARLDVAALLDEEEAAGWDRIGVVVCGPAGLCDDVRALVVARARAATAGGTVWELCVEAFSW